MDGLLFICSEFLVWIILLAAVLASYVLLLVFSLRFQSLVRFLSFLQALAFSLAPVLLTLENRKGFSSDDVAIRLLEEVSLHVLRYNVFIRPLVGFFGVCIDTVFLKSVFEENSDMIVHSNWYEAAWKRASMPRHDSWLTLLDSDSGPLTAWITASHCICILFENRSIINDFEPGDSQWFGDIQLSRVPAQENTFFFSKTRLLWAILVIVQFIGALFVLFVGLVLGSMSSQGSFKIYRGVSQGTETI